MPRAAPRQTGLMALLQAGPIKTLAGTLAALGIIIGALLTADARYAQAGDIRAIAGQLEINRLSGEVAVLEIRRSTLQDRVFEAQARSARKESQSDRAINARYTSELSDIERQLAEKRALVDRLRTGK